MSPESDYLAIGTHIKIDTSFFFYKVTDFTNNAFNLSRISVQGTYRFNGPFFLTELRKNTMDIDIKEVDLSENFINNVPVEKRPLLKGLLMIDMLCQSAASLFSDYDSALCFTSHMKAQTTFHSSWATKKLYRFRVQT